MDESVNVALEEFGISRDQITEFIPDNVAKLGEGLS